MKQKLITATICGAMISALVPYNAFALTQDETVYAKLDAGGTLSYVSVTGHLINDLNDSQIVMKADLQDIENLNGFEDYLVEGSDLIWKADGNDIYYSGKTDQKLPIEVAVTYKLNNEVKSLEEILGQSGKVEIKLKYKNLSKVGDLYTPFVVAMGTILDETNARNVEVTNGKVISNGKNIIVSAIAAPGLYESLRYEDLQKMDEIVLTYDTEKFELGDIYSFVTPKVLEDNDLKIFDKMDDLYVNADKLSDGSKELVDGTNKLRDGVKQLRDSVASAKAKLTGLGNLMSESMLDSIAETAAKSARSKVAEQKSTIRAQIDAQFASIPELKQLDNLKATLQSLAPTLIEQTVTAKIQELITNGVKQGVSDACAAGTYGDCTNPDISAAVQDAVTKQVTQQVMSQKDAITQEVAAQIASQMNVNIDINSIKEKLFQNTYNAMQNVAAQTASETARTVASQVASSIQSGLSKKLNTLMDEMVKGIDQLLNGASQLSDGMQKFDQDGIQVLTNFVNGDIKNTSRKLERLTKLADEYNNFGGKAENAQHSTKFVLMIEGKKA